MTLDDPIIGLLFAAALGQLLGSIPFGLLLTRAAGLGDIRAIGSGNIGATNVLRTGHRGLALATLLLDAAKGAVAVLIAQALVSDALAAPLAGLAAVFGHTRSPWLAGQGGKGVATALGVFAAFAWPAGLVACAAWVAGAAVTRISSIGGIAAMVAGPIAAAAVTDATTAVACALIAAWVIGRHEENINRLRAGTEPRIGEGR